MDGFKDTTRTQYYTLTPAERDMSRETSRIVPQRAQENKMQGAKRGVVVNTKPATTPATRDGARRMSDLDRRTMEEPSAPYKKGGKVMKKGRKAEGGSVKNDAAQDKALIKKAFRQHDSQEHKSGKGTKLSLAKGGKPKKMAKGGSVSSASSRGDGCCTKGKTKGRFV